MAVGQCCAPHSHSQTQNEVSLMSSTHDIQGHSEDLNPAGTGKEYGESNLQFFMCHAWKVVHITSIHISLVRDQS